jgi:hypothetical protein
MKPGFPPGWPPGCPPVDAEDANGIVYRATMNSPPTSDDFLSLREKNQKPRYPLTRAGECRYCAVSVYRTMVDAQHHLQVFPWDSKFIARGALTPDCGKTKLTPHPERPSHTEWWPFDGLDRCKCFQVI